MKLNKLLEKQLKKYLPESCRDKEEFQRFIHAVNDSYSAYERDIVLADHAFHIAEDEYREVNRRLKEELSTKEASINKLKEVVTNIGDSSLGDINGDNDVLSIASYLKNQVAKRAAIEQQLHDQKAFYERILNLIPADIAIVDKDHRYLFVNPTAIKNPEIRAWIIGKTDEDYHRYRNKPVADTIKRKAHFYEVVKAGVQKEWEEKIVTPSGHTEYHLRVLHPVLKNDGSLDIMIIYGFNITERKKIEEQIKLSEARYRSIFDNSQALICTHDMNGVVLEVNQAAVKAFGYSREELIGRPVYQLLPIDKQEDFRTSYLKMIRKEGKAEGVMIALNKEGKRIYLLYQNFMVAEQDEEPYVIGFSQDVTGRTEAEKALKKSEEKYRNIIANMNLGLVEVDPDEKIIYANNSFCEMSGYERDELIGRNAGTLLLKGDNQNLGSDVSRRRREGKSDAYEIKVKNKRGELKWWLISGAPVVDNDGSFRGSTGIHLDITVQKKLEEELRKAKDEAERSAQAKELFLANMSHEIRTPMNAILGIGSLLMKTQMNDDQKYYLRTIHGAANNLLVIINDLLDFSKIEAGMVTLEYIGFNLTRLVDNALQMLQFKAEEKKLSFTGLVAPGIAPVLIGDPYRINQVITNLLSNAIKFTPKGSVGIVCSLLKDNDNKQEIQFSVTDTGIGIDEKFISQLFDKFAQEDESVTRRFGGTGLGMSICKELTGLMGGTITVSSKKNEGTTISFVLTLPKGTEKDLPVKKEQRVRGNALKGRRILLAEDNEMNQLLASTILMQSGAEVIEAANGEIAIEKLKEHLFDLILMDVQMPVKDGIETTQIIRKTISKTIPIIALTANAFQQEADRCLQAGMNDFVAKPFEEHVLIATIAKYLDPKNDTIVADEIQEKNGRQLYDLDKIRSVSRGDDAFVKKMLQLFVDTLPDTVRQMQQAFEDKHWQSLSALAHRIKPSFHNMGIVSLEKEIKELEKIDPLSADPDIAAANLARLTTITAQVIEQLKEDL